LNLRHLDTGLTLLLLAAFISFCFSVVLWFFADRESGIFVGLWVPSILSFGVLIRGAR
jgi:hypothetical protein